MLLPLSVEIVILSAMTIFRPVFGFFVCCLLLGNAGDVVAQPSLPQRVYPSAQSVHQSQPVPQQSQASADLHQPWNLHEFSVRSGNSGMPYRLVSDSQQPGTPQSNVSGAPQSHTQPTAQRTPPPAGGLQRLLTPRVPQRAPTQRNAPSQTASPQMASQTAAPPETTSVRAASPTLASRIPILGIGRDFLNEFRPSNDRKWSQNHAVLQTATFNGNIVTVHNVRYSRYESAEVYATQHYDATFNLDDIRSIDLVMVPFQGLDRLAHVESSFGFADGRHIGMSIEARYEEGEKYDPAAAGLRQFELIYVFADERDMIRLATDVNKNDVFIYRLNFEPHEVRTMFVDALQRANKLAAQPEFYHPITNSCVTNLIDHINKGRPRAVPREYRTLIPGLLDSYMYDLKLIATSAQTFKETKEMAKVNWLVERYGDLEYFSAGIRQNMY